MDQSAVESCPEVIVDLGEKPIHVLLVDDEVCLLKVSKQCLEMQGIFQVDTASSVDEAMEKMKKQTFDVLVSDYQMPGKDGLEFLETLRKNGDRSPFILFTGRGREEVAINALNLGADRYLNKAGDPETVYRELGHAIRKAAEQKKAEEALETCGERYRRLFESAVEGILINGSDGRISSLNPAAANILGYNSPKELIGKPATELYADPDSRARFIQELAEKGHAKERELTWKKKDGTLIEILASVTAQKDEKGNLLRTEGIIRDISERKASERLLRESEKKYRSLVEQSMQGILIAQGPVPHMVFANSAMSKILGYSFEELLSLSPQQTTELVHPDDRELFFGRFEDRLEGKHVPPQYEIRGIRKDGTVVWLELSSARIEYEGQQAVQAIFTDITERKQAEEKKYGLAHDLNERVKELTCLYGMSKIITKHGDSIEEIMQGTVLLLPPAYQHPDIVCARIVWENRKYVTGNFRETCWSQKTDIKANGKIVGAVEVYYLQEKLERDKELFLKEEKNLLDAVAERLGRVIERVRERTRQQNEERETLESQRKFEGLFRHNPEAAVYLDVNFKIRDANPRFCELFGCSAEEVEGRNINEVVVPEGLHEEAESLDKDAKNGYARHDTVRRRKDGSLVPVSVSAAPVTFEDKLLGYVGIYKDITDLRKAEEESEESRKHFHMLFDLMADPVAVVDGSGRILEVTRKVAEITGFKREELVGRNLLKVKMFGAKTKAVMIKSLAKRMMGIHLQPYEVEVLKKDGGKLMYEINAARIDYKGKPADLVVFRDVLERKNLEEKLRVVGSLTRHDVRNKLSAVTGNVYLLKRKLAGNPEVLEWLVDMENAIRNTEAILEFARTYEQLGVEQLVKLNVGKAVDEAASLFSGLKDIKIVNECHDLTVLADSLLRQLFYNLIDNSLKYGKKLSQIRIRYEKGEEKQLRLVYDDDGVGIPKDSKAKLFTQGFTTGKGSGYGLYMIKRMVDVYGWTISETGTHGKGAQFTISIPEAKPDGRQNYKLG